LASRANAYYSTDPPAGAATEPTAGNAEGGQGMAQMRVDAAAQVAEVAVPVSNPARAYTAYEPGIRSSAAAS
jgi:hypothetical protein